MVIQTTCQVCNLQTLGSIRCRGCSRRSCPRCLVVEKVMCKVCASRI